MSAIKQYVTFFSDEQMYGIDIRLVSDVYPQVDIMPVPLTAAHIRGLVNIRGQVVIVMDIAVILGKKERPITSKSHVIVLKTISDLRRIGVSDTDFNISNFEDKPVGFLADQVGDVVSVFKEDIEKPTQHIKKTDFQFIGGIIKLDNQLLITIEPDRIIKYQKSS